MSTGPSFTGQYIQLPSLTTTERDALTAAAGMIVYNSTTATLQKYEGGAWVSLGGSAAISTIKEAGSNVVTSAVSLDFKDANAEDLGSGAAALYLDLPHICQGRLTLTTAVPVTTSDVTAATTIYFTPYKGSQVSLYDGTRWKKYAFTERSLSLSGFTASTPYDIFLYDNSGTLTLEALIWTNDTTRATALVLQDGVYVKTGATTRRYLGTIRITGSTGQCEDSILNRLVWNMYNRIPRSIQITDTTDSWTYTGTSWRSWDNSTANRVTFIRGLNEDEMMLNFMGCISVSSSLASLGIGLDSTSTPTGTFSRFGASILGATTAHYSAIPGLGYHYLQLLEYSSAATTTFYGDNAGTFVQSGANGFLMA